MATIAATGFGWLLLAIHGLESLEPIVTVENTDSVTSVTVGGTQFWIALVARLLAMPRGTLLYDSDIRHMSVFHPEREGRD